MTTKREEFKTMADKANQTLTAYEEKMVSEILKVCENRAKAGHYTAEYTKVYEQAPFPTLLHKLEQALKQEPYCLKVKSVQCKPLSRLYKLEIIVAWGE